jgi:hypothetical protein
MPGRIPLIVRSLVLIYLAAAGVLVACRDTRSSDTARARAGNDSGVPSPYFADSSGRAGARGVPGTQTGRDLEAPQVLPAVAIGLVQLQRQANDTSTANRTAHKNQLSRLVNAMIADLTRVGLADSGAFHALADSVLEDTDGGTGVSKRPKPDEVPAHVARVNRLITTYQRMMASAKKR